MNTSTIELLFQLRQQGAAEIEQVAASVGQVSTAAAGASANVDALEAAIRALTAETISNTAALGAMEGRLNSGTAAMGGFAGGSRVATGELRELNGQMSIMMAGRFLSSMQALQPIMAGLFPVAGAIALIGFTGELLDKTGLLPKAWEKVTESQKEVYKEMDAQSKKYDELIGKANKLRLEKYGLDHGPEALKVLEGTEAQSRAGGLDHQQIEMLEKQIAVLTKMANPHSGGRTFVPNASDAFLANMAGMGHQGWLNDSNVQAGVFDDHAAARAKELLPEYQQRLRTANAQQYTDTVAADTDDAKEGSELRKKSQEEAAKRAREIAQVEKEAAGYLRQAQTFELSGMDKINATCREKLDLLKQLKALGASGSETNTAGYNLQEGHNIEVNRERARVIAEARKLAAKGAQEAIDARDSDGRADLRGYDKEFREGQAKTKKDTDHDYDANMKVLQASDDSDADAVKRQLGASLRSNKVSAAMGSMTPQGAAGADYQDRVNAANEIFRIETQHLNLIDDEDKKQEKLAQARKRWADEIYRAEEDNENALQSLRERDLQKYHALAGSIFDALHTHSVNQWARGFATDQLKTVFGNATAPILQQAGHVLGGVIPNVGPLGTLLHGTVFDSANKGTSDASTTAKQTERTADEVHALRGDIRAMSGSQAPAGATDGGAGVSMGGTALDQMLSLPTIDRSSAALGALIPGMGSLGPGFAGTGASSLFQAGGGSGMTQFMSGLGGAGSNPLQAIFGGYSTNGSTVTQLTGIQQAGAAVGTGAMLAGAGLGIASGIEQGGVGGYTKAAASGLGAIAALDPEPISKMVLSAVGAFTGMIGAMFGTGPAQRTQQLTDDISKNQYLAPTAWNVMQGMDGTYQDFDAHGNIRTSTMSAIPTVAEPYITKRTLNGQQGWYDAPGVTQSPYSGGARGTGQAPVAGGVTNNYISAVDAQSFHEFLQRPASSAAVGASIATHLHSVEGAASAAIRFVSQG